jgi:threonine dehydrogenase-like Zn-dependent dehydrogenase
MQAVRCDDFGESTVVDVPRPEPGDDEVLIEVARVQLSVTECQIYRGHEIGGHAAVKEAMDSGDGLVFGHEFCGTVVESGPSVDGLSVGDRVYAPAKIACDSCAYCEAGYRQLCADKETIGMGRPGALAEYVALPAEPLAPLPDAVSDAEGAAMQPLASALMCVEDAGISTGDEVAVVGCGVMGYQCGQLALEEGASRVVAVDVDPAKLDHAADRGMEPVDARETDPVAAVESATGGVGADVVFEAVGGEQRHATAGDEPLAQSFSMVRPGGTVGQVGIVVDELTLDPRTLRKKSVTWVNPRFGAWQLGPNAHTGTLAPRLVADGRVTIEEFLTHELDGLGSFEEAVEVTADKPAHGALGPAQILV